MANTLKTVLLLALPASGKSEVRRFLKSLSVDEAETDFHLGGAVQLDDYPYVYLMRCIDDELDALGEPRLFFQAPDKPFQDTRDWLTLIELINEDYDHLVRRETSSPDSAARYFFDRIDAASMRAGGSARIKALAGPIRDAIADKLEAEARSMLKDLHANHPDSLDGKTVVIEFARGGPQGSELPLPAYYGYKHSLAQLSPAILEHATILYVWVTPEESRRKNDERTDPNDPGSILHHGVPLDVMLNDYGCDDMDWLEANTGSEGHVGIEAHGRVYDLAVARFDNRVDKTSFIRDEPDLWKAEDVAAIHSGLRDALTKLWSS